MDKLAEHRREIEQLRALAAWYRGWAELGGSAEERQSRRLLAKHIELKAQQLEAAND
ncbi:MAG TPA: hypothetical protein VMU87_02080 [Stellaceae bacterium]|nr:hypothetical protein [Stellaceae bacterium]